MILWISAISVNSEVNALLFFILQKGARCNKRDGKDVMVKSFGTIPARTEGKDPFRPASREDNASGWEK